jgi:hypothetical protein
MRFLVEVRSDPAAAIKPKKVRRLAECPQTTSTVYSRRIDLATDEYHFEGGSGSIKLYGKEYPALATDPKGIMIKVKPLNQEKFAQFVADAKASNHHWEINTERKPYHRQHFANAS